MMSENTFTVPYKTLFIASDHAGLDMKLHLIGRFPFLPWKDLGTNSTASVDYPDFAKAVCERLEPELGAALGVLVCGSGQGMAIRANRYSFIRAALAWDQEVARLARAHNDANVLCLAGRLIAPATAEQILKAFLTTPFEGGRHQGRVDKLNC